MPPIKRKRQRIVVVCTNCKMRKKKCDKKLPCTTCRNSDLSEQCNYEYDENLSTPSYMLSANKPIDLVKKSDELACLKVKEERNRNPKSSGKQVNSGQNNVPFKPISAVSKGSRSKANGTLKILASQHDTHRQQIGNQIPKFSHKYEENVDFSSQEAATTKSILLRTDQRSTNSYLKIHSKSGYRCMVGINPCSGSDESINFYTSLHVAHNDVLNEIHGSFSWTSLMLRDPALKVLWAHAQSQADKDGSDIIHKVSRTPVSDTSINELASNCHIKEKYMHSSQMYLSISNKNEFLDCILSILPSRKTTWDLVEHFFTEVYPFMPFLDERYFKAQVSRILFCENNGVMFTEVNIFNGSDYAYLGLLFVVLKLSYLSLFSNISIGAPEAFAKNLKPFADFHNQKAPSLDPRLIHFAIRCIEWSDLSNSDGFSVFLLALFVKLYKKYAPEDEDVIEGGKTQKLNWSIIRRAIHIGLDQGKTSYSSRGLEVDHLKKKIWCFLILSDLSQGYSYGYDAYISMSQLDTEIPLFDKESSNLVDKQYDKEVTDFFFKCCKLTQSLRSLLKLVLNKGGSKTSEVCKKITEFEFNLDDDIGPLDACFHSQHSQHSQHSHDQLDNFRHLFGIKYHLAFDVFLINLFWHMFLHYEARNSNVSYFYLKKAFLLVFEIYPHCYNILNKSTHPNDFIINPSMEKFIHKANQILLSFLVRIKFMTHELSANNAPFEVSTTPYLHVMQQIRDSLIQNIRHLLFSLSNLAGVYNNAHHIIKTYEFFLNLLTSSQVIEKGYNDSDQDVLGKFRPSFCQLSELLVILQTPSQSSEDIQNINLANVDSEGLPSSFENLEFNLQYDIDLESSFFDASFSI